jgi:hypothetical protein
MDLRETIKRILKEGLDDKWTSDDNQTVTLRELLDIVKDIPVTKMPTKRLIKHALHGDNPDEQKNIEKADLKYPVLILVNDDESIKFIVDGHHRIQKAFKHKLPTIKAKLIKFSELPKKFRKVLGGEKEEDKEGVGAYAAPAFEMKPDHEHFQHLYNESLDPDYSEKKIYMIEKMVSKMELPSVESFKVDWSDVSEAYVIRLFYPKNVDDETKWKNEMDITSIIRPFLDLPFYSVIVRSYYREKPNKFIGGINENYTTWVKRRMDMVRDAEREASRYMIKIFKLSPIRFTKNKFINLFFSTMMDELHGYLSKWGTEDFDYSKVHQELRDSFRDYVEELWKHLNK